jgi:hypothetical protein
MTSISSQDPSNALLDSLDEFSPSSELNELEENIDPALSHLSFPVGGPTVDAWALLSALMQSDAMQARNAGPSQSAASRQLASALIRRYGLSDDVSGTLDQFLAVCSFSLLGVDDG